PGVVAPPVERTASRLDPATRRAGARLVPLSTDTGDPDTPIISRAVPKAPAPSPIPAAVPKAPAPSPIPAAVPEAPAPAPIPATAKEGAEPETAASSATGEPSFELRSALPNAETAIPPPPAGDRLSAEEMATLLTRGDNLLRAGDVAS